MRRTLRYVLLSACLLAITVVPVFAQVGQPAVTTAAISADGSTLFVTGRNFGASPSVSLGGYALGGSWSTAREPRLPP